MRRKYDIRNKRNFLIILILSIIIIGIFSLFIYKYKHASRIEYKVNTGSIVQDSNKNYINVNDDAVLRMRWNGNYYLVYNNKNISLSKKVIVYDTIKDNIKLYGKFYEIDSDGKIAENNNETILNNKGECKFYKLDDREYLLVDKNISSNDKSIDASGYLLVELDRMGNAKLSNYKLNLKTINPTTLMTSNYIFDIANEKLKYNSLEIDLKKIIGSTNQYKEEENKEDNKDSNGSSGNDNNNVATNTNIIDANGTGNNPVVTDNTKNGDNVTIEEVRNKTKMTSIIRTKTNLTSIDVDYVIYDPYAEYKTIYAEIIKPEEVIKDGEIFKQSTVETVPIDRYDNHITFGDLIPNHVYNIKFYYTTIDKETEDTIITKFEELNLKTNMPEYNIEVYKISAITNRIYYKVYLQNGYDINRINVSLSFDYRDNDEVKTESISSVLNYSSVNLNSEEQSECTFGASTKIARCSIKIANYDIVNTKPLKLNIDSVVNSNNNILEINRYQTFKLGDN